jgi:hypothetical protein
MYFDVNAHIAFEGAVGATLIDTMQEISENLQRSKAAGTQPKMPSVKMIRALLWAGLRSDTLDAEGNDTERTLSMHQIGAMMDLGMLMQQLHLIAEAFAISMDGMPSKNPQKAPAHRKGSRSTGSGSGASLISNGASTGCSMSGG